MRSVFFVTLIPCALSHALCSARALVSAAVLGSLTLLGFGVDSFEHWCPVLRPREFDLLFFGEHSGHRSHNIHHQPNTWTRKPKAG